MKRELGELIGYVLVLASITIFIAGGTIKGFIIANNEFKERLKSEGFEVLHDAKRINKASNISFVEIASEFIELARGKTVYFDQGIFYVMQGENASLKADCFTPNLYWRWW